MAKHQVNSKLVTRQRVAIIAGAAGASMFALMACAETRLGTHVAKSVGDHKSIGVYKVGNPYEINGQWYYPKEQPNYSKVGIASWYGPQFHGKKTANGEVFDMNTVSAAHPTLPMPTLVKVTNLENGRSLVIRVNDRGPFVSDREIDLSRRAAELLGYADKGLAKVRVDYLGRAPLDPNAPVQVASAGAIPPSAVPKAERRPASPLEGAPVGAVASAPLTSPNGATPPARPAMQPIPDAQASVQPAAYQDTVSLRTSMLPTKTYVQAGAFLSEANAQLMSARLNAVGTPELVQVQVEGITYYKVRLGPFANHAEAADTLARVTSQFEPGARIVAE